jgi:hypothetical protein
MTLALQYDLCDGSRCQRGLSQNPVSAVVSSSNHHGLNGSSNSHASGQQINIFHVINVLQLHTESVMQN